MKRLLSYNQELKKFVYPCCSAHNACKDGSVYILKNNDVYKIGYTSSNHGECKSIKGRFSAFRNKDFSIFHSMYTVCAYGLERYLHKKFENKRIRNELFKLSDNDIDFILKIREHANKPVMHTSY